MTRVVHLTHSRDLRTGGVIEAVLRLDESLRAKGISSAISDDPQSLGEDATHFIVHGLWQWPGLRAWKRFKTTSCPYIVFPHGMMDPWFKKTFPLKHLKKQAYWLWRQGRIMRHAHAVCFTTEEERRLARETFWPSRYREVVSGLGVGSPPGDEKGQKADFIGAFPELSDRRILLYLGRMHPKKGLDMLLRSFLGEERKDEALVLAGPVEKTDPFTRKLLRSAEGREKEVVWTGMLEGDLKWGALRAADALVLPSHQENYGMVVAEALSVGTPVLLTDKVNLWREVKQARVGLVAKDDQAGIDGLVSDWRAGRHNEVAKAEACKRCFEENLHIASCADRVIELLGESSQARGGKRA